ncbi:MAG: YggT family protein [Saccharospirillaceae bacterium]|nr:YggT family protein [Pseudomonadales bacterium]NRB78952.1 YggT family protein [Saccharospirillaceae bacterium]
MQQFSLLLIQLPAMFLCIGFVVRFLGQIGRADFYNPLGQTTLSVTNWLIMPLRKVIPSMGKYDISCLVAIYLTQLAFGALTLVVAGYSNAILAPEFFLMALVGVAGAFITVLSISMFIMVIASFLLAGQHNPFIAFITQFVDPFLGPFKKMNIQIGMLDLSFLVAILVLQAIKMLALIPLVKMLGYAPGFFFGL